LPLSLAPCPAPPQRKLRCLPLRGWVYKAEDVVEHEVTARFWPQLEGLGKAHWPVATVHLILVRLYIDSIAENAYHQGTGDHNEDTTILGARLGVNRIGAMCDFLEWEVLLNVNRLLRAI